MAAEQSVDDLESCPQSSSYVCSSHMYTHVGTVPRNEKQKKSFKGQKEKKKKEEEEEGVSGGQSQWKAGEHVRESPLLSALASLSLTSLDQPVPASTPAGPLPTTPKPSRNSPLTSASKSCRDDPLGDPIRSKDALEAERSVRKPPNMATNGPKVVSPQDVYVPMDRIVKAARSHVDKQTERQRGGTDTQETTRTVNNSQEVATADR